MDKFSIWRKGERGRNKYVSRCGGRSSSSALSLHQKLCVGLINAQSTNIEVGLLHETIRPKDEHLDVMVITETWIP